MGSWGHSGVRAGAGAYGRVLSSPSTLSKAWSSHMCVNGNDTETGVGHGVGRSLQVSESGFGAAGGQQPWSAAVCPSNPTGAVGGF